MVRLERFYTVNCACVELCTMRGFRCEGHISFKSVEVEALLQRKCQRCAIIGLELITLGVQYKCCQRSLLQVSAFCSWRMQLIYAALKLVHVVFLPLCACERIIWPVRMNS